MQSIKLFITKIYKISVNLSPIFQPYCDSCGVFLYHKTYFSITQKKTLILQRFFERRRPDLNRWILVLQTIALPLGYCALYVCQTRCYYNAGKRWVSISKTILRGWETDPVSQRALLHNPQSHYKDLHSHLHASQFHW